jgi:UDP-glucose 4-epimerase
MDMSRGASEDARRIRNVVDAIESHRAEVVVHLAAKVGRLFGEDDVMETVRDNAGMTAVVAKACGDLGVRLVYASTSEVYGDNGMASCEEFTGPFSLPHNVYGLSKYFGESLGKLYAPERFTALRFSMPYGPGLHAGRGRAAIINMLWQAKYGKEMQVHIGAERSWCWVGDTVRAARLAITSGEGPYNVGRDDAAVSMLEVAQIACELTGADESLISLVEAPPRQTVVKRLSTKRIERLGWSPAVSLREGMQITLETWVDHLAEDGSPVVGATL